MWYVRFVRNGKNMIRRVRNWDALCNAIEDLQSEGIDASNWGEYY
jgi:hypothetical protein